VLGLPDGVTALLFDMDGVLTKTAVVHEAAWKQTFDEVLRDRAGAGSFEPFTHDDYDTYVDGRTRADGVRSFLASRHIDLPDGADDDAAGTGTVNAIGNKKNELLLARVRRDGVEAYEGSLRYLEAATKAGLRRAVVSASANAADVLSSAGLSDHIEVRIDGVVVSERHLRGKPAPDTYLEAAKALGVEPSAAAVFEDALSGVEAGRAGHFAAVIGVDRVGQADALRSHGATRVVGDLAELLEGDDGDR
jgi:beta-phosphoglucomutase family hydrolase